MKVGRERRRLDALGPGAGRDGSVVHALRQPRDEMHPGLVGSKAEIGVDPVRHRVEQHPLAFGIERAHAADVGREVALGDEVGEGGLGDRGRVGVDQHPDPDEGVDQVLGHDHVADAQPREHHLGERADVDHPALLVETLEGRQRPAAVAVLAVVIVLEDEGVGLARPLQELEPPGQAHDHAERILVRGRDAGEPGGGREFAAGGDAQPLVVDRYRRQAGTGGEQRAAHARVAGFLHPHRVAGVDQHPRHQVERLLRPGNDHDLVRGARHRPGGAEILRDRLAQGPIAGRVGRDQEAHRRPPPAPGDQPGPVLEREAGELGQARREGPWSRLLPGANPGEIGAAFRRAAAAVGLARPSSGRRPCVQQLLGQGRRHVGSGPGPPLDIALRVQLLEGGDHGVARQAEIARQGPGRRQPLARRQAAVEDRLADREIG